MLRAHSAPLEANIHQIWQETRHPRACAVSEHYQAAFLSFHWNRDYFDVKRYRKCSFAAELHKSGGVLMGYEKECAAVRRVFELKGIIDVYKLCNR